MLVPIHTDIFYHDGRGPELQHVHWSHRGAVLRAIEYYNPDDTYDSLALKHVLFDACQVVQITPEEIIQYARVATHLAGSSAAMFDLGRSDWLASFSPLHLKACSHFRLMFYDELVDVICERITCVRGPFREPAGL